MCVAASKRYLNSLVQFTKIAAGNIDMYSDNLHRLREAVKRKFLEIWRTKFRGFLHDNAPAHRSVLMKDFLGRNSVTTLKYPPYSRELTAADFYLFPRM